MTHRGPEGRERPDDVRRLQRLAEGLRALQHEIEQAIADRTDEGVPVGRYEIQPPAALEIAEAVAIPSTAERMPVMIEAMMPASVPTAPAVLQARRNTAARVALIEEFGLLTSADVAELNQSQATNRAALASRWKGEERIFSVPYQGKDYFPGFQFGPDGRPREIVAEVLAALGAARGWQTALWFAAGNGYLNGRRPVDLLDSQPDAVTEAARHESVEVYF